MTGPAVRLVGAEPSGLAEIVAGLLSQRLERDPGAADRLRRSTVVLRVPDAEVEITVRLAPGGVVVRDGDAPDADLRVTARSDRLLALAATPLRAGLPDPTTRAGREVAADLIRGRIRLGGAIRHPRHVVRFASLLNVAHPAEASGP